MAWITERKEPKERAEELKKFFGNRAREVQEEIIQELKTAHFINSQYENQVLIEIREI
jgi:hypothetical protein